MSMVEACMEAGIIIQASMRHFGVVEKYSTYLSRFAFSEHWDPRRRKTRVGTVG
jgi:hypothetical protein